MIRINLAARRTRLIGKSVGKIVKSISLPDNGAYQQLKIKRDALSYTSNCIFYYLHQLCRQKLVEEPSSTFATRFLYLGLSRSENAPYSPY